MRTAHIGAAGELLVQYKLLKLGIDSARLTTDAGTDLVAYSPMDQRALTVQVKTKHRLTPAGGRGLPAADWTFREDLDVNVLALVLLERDTAWLFTADEARAIAQQRHPNGNRLAFFYDGDGPPRPTAKTLLLRDIDSHLLETRAPDLLTPTT